MYSAVDVFLLHRVLIDLNVKNTSLCNSHKKKIVRRLDARSHMTPDLGDTRLFSDIHFAYSIKGPTGKNGTKSVDVMVP